MFARSKHTAHTFRSGGTIDTAVLIEVRSTRLDEKTESMSCSHLNKLKKCIACSRHRIQSHVCYELLNRYLLNIRCFKVGFARGRAWLCHMQVYWSLQRLDTCMNENQPLSQITDRRFENIQKKGSSSMAPSIDSRCNWRLLSLPQEKPVKLCLYSYQEFSFRIFLDSRELKRVSQLVMSFQLPNPYHSHSQGELIPHDTWLFHVLNSCFHPYPWMAYDSSIQGQWMWSGEFVCWVLAFSSCPPFSFYFNSSDSGI